MGIRKSFRNRLALAEGEPLHRKIAIFFASKRRRRILAVDKAPAKRKSARPVKKKAPAAPDTGPIFRQQVAGWLRRVHAERPEIGAVEVLLDGISLGRFRTDRARMNLVHVPPVGPGPSELELMLNHLDEGEREICLVLPEGERRNRPLLLPSRPHAAPPAIAAPARLPAVVVPVYNAPDDLETCIARLHAHTPRGTDILFIDDASPDPRIRDILAGAALLPDMRVLVNEQNLGFTRTVNRGLRETGRRDVIILNSDARVTAGWVEGMTSAAASAPRIATVTAMSDRAGAFSAPERGNENDLPAGVTEEGFAAAFRRHSLRLRPVVPTGNGFCMLISRACLDEIGALDAEAFPRGYGEENDFCLRARRAGWRHLVDDATYVFHDRSKSFGEAKSPLLAAGRQVIDARYPEYKRSLGVYEHGPDLMLARFRAREVLDQVRREAEGHQRLLYVISTQTGGTPQTNQDLMRALSDRFSCWVLRCDSHMLELSQLTAAGVVPVRSHSLTEPVDAISHDSAEYERVVSDWIAELAPSLVHIRHLGWHSLALPRIVKAQGIPLVISFHDYYALCPTVKLLDDTGTFCGGTCTATPGECTAELWPANSLPPLKGAWVHVWRERFARALAQGDAFVTTSDSARDRHLRHMPSLPADRFHVIPHGRDFTGFDRLRAPLDPGGPLRILIPGNINDAKGLQHIHALLDRDTDRRLEFHILGKLKSGPQNNRPRLIAHGAYDREDFAARVAQIRPHAGAMLSIWDETYCHTLTEMWSVGIPVAVLDFPTVAGRVRDSGAGWVVGHEDADTFYADLLRLATDPAEVARTDRAVADWQAGEGSQSTTRAMGERYLGIYRTLLGAADGGIGAQADRPAA